MTESREARERRALGLLARQSEVIRAALQGEVLPPRPTVDSSVFLADARALQASDRASAQIFAEAYAAGATRRAWGAYLEAWRGKTFKLKGEPGEVGIGSLASVVTTEGGTARREALIAAGDAAVRDLRGDAMGVVDAVRDATEALGAEITIALGVGDAGADTVLNATEEIFRELDARVTRGLGLDRARLTWADRLRSVVARSIQELVPPATWAMVAGQWMTRAGLAHAAGRIRNELYPASRAATGVVALSDEDDRAVIAGRPSEAGEGALDVAGALGEALVHVTGMGETAGQRRGVDAGAVAIGRALVRRMYLNRHFVRREAGVDVGPRERAMVEALHAEVVSMRIDAAYAGFAEAARTRTPDLAGRFVASMSRAVGCAPSPLWAVHTAARMLTVDGRWGARVAGSLAEPTLANWLRDRYDDDWFRNPRAGMGLTNALNDIRRLGVVPWREAMGGDAGKSLALRLSDALREAERTTL